MGILTKQHELRARSTSSWFLVMFSKTHRKQTIKSSNPSPDVFSAAPRLNTLSPFASPFGPQISSHQRTTFYYTQTFNAKRVENEPTTDDESTYVGDPRLRGCGGVGVGGAFSLLVFRWASSSSHRRRHRRRRRCHCRTFMNDILYLIKISLSVEIYSYYTSYTTQPVVHVEIVSLNVRVLDFIASFSDSPEFSKIRMHLQF